MDTLQPNMKPGQLGRLGPGGATRSSKTIGFFDRPAPNGVLADNCTWRIIEVGEIFLYVETIFLEVDPVTGHGLSNENIIDVILIGDQLLYVGGHGDLEPLV